MIATSTPAPIPLIQRAEFVVFDIETADAPLDAIEAAAKNWKAPSNWKAETVEKKRAEHLESLREKGALLDASPVACVGLRTPHEGRLFAGVGAFDPPTLPGWSPITITDDEPHMLAALRGWLDQVADESTILVGHNVRGFDLPKLRGAYVRHRQPLPRCLRPSPSGPSQPVVDTMHLFKHFSMEHRDSLFVSLETVCASFGVPRPKSVVSGADVPRMIRDGRLAEVLIYQAIDVDATAEIYRLMMQ